jgi:hypothetical protein
MKTLFTIHAGEFLVGEHFETVFKKNVNVWIPAKDTGIDLLVTDKTNKKTVSLQVKFSRDYPHSHVDFERPPRASGWLPIKRRKLENSSADFWVLVLLAFDRKTTDFIILPRKKLLDRLNSIHGHESKVIHCYLWATSAKTASKRMCWETRGLKHADEVLISKDEYKDADRDFTGYLNNWEPIHRLLK